MIKGKCKSKNRHISKKSYKSIKCMKFFLEKIV